MKEKIKVKNAILQDKMYIFKKDISDPARFESKFREIIDKDIFEWFDYDREMARIRRVDKEWRF